MLQKVGYSKTHPTPRKCTSYQSFGPMPNKAENESFSALFFAFSWQNRAFSHHFYTTRNSENFLTTYLTTVGAEANRLVASAPVFPNHIKSNNSKGSRRYSLENLFPCLLRISFCFQLRHTPIQPVGSNNRHFSYASHFHRPCERQSWQNNWLRHRIGTARERR